MEALENKKRSNYDSIFKDILKQHINKRRSKKENHRKSNDRKRKQTENDDQQVYGICVGNPLGSDLSRYSTLCTLLGWPSQKSVLKLMMLPRHHLDEMGRTSHSSCKRIISPMLQEAELLPTLSRKSGTMFTPSCTLKSTL